MKNNKIYEKYFKEKKITKLFSERNCIKPDEYKINL